MNDNEMGQCGTNEGDTTTPMWTGPATDPTEIHTTSSRAPDQTQPPVSPPNQPTDPSDIAITSSQQQFVTEVPARQRRNVDDSEFAVGDHRCFLIRIENSEFL